MRSQNGTGFHTLALAVGFRKGSPNRALLTAARELVPASLPSGDTADAPSLAR